MLRIGDRIRLEMLPHKESVIQLTMHAIANIGIGVSLLLWSNLTAESILMFWFPYWFWPCMFIGAGVCGVFGVFNRVTAQFSFVFAAIVTFIFGLASLYAVIWHGAWPAMASTIFLLYIAELKVALAWVIARQESIVSQVTEATEKGQSALDNISTGTKDGSTTT